VFCYSPIFTSTTRLDDELTLWLLSSMDYLPILYCTTCGHHELPNKYAFLDTYDIIYIVVSDSVSLVSCSTLAVNAKSISHHSLIWEYSFYYVHSIGFFSLFFYQLPMVTWEDDENSNAVPSYQEVLAPVNSKDIK